MKVLRVYHAGRDGAHRGRERALVGAGIEVTLVVPTTWPGADDLGDENFRVIELETTRSGDVNRHTYADPAAIEHVLTEVRPDVVDLHEEPFAAVTRQWLRAVPAQTAVVAYSAQNIDKRWPPPFHQYERAAFARLAGIYPCSRQAASVLRGKGYRGQLTVVPLGVDDTAERDLRLTHSQDPFTLMVVGRLVPEKGITHAVQALAAVSKVRPARLIIVGSGPEGSAATALAAELGVADSLEVHPWVGPDELDALYRRAHIVLVPSLTTRTWVEQFGRVITEGQANGAVIVGYDSGSIPEVLDDRGIVVGEGDVRALSDAVALLAEDAERWAALRLAGQDFTASLSWPRVAQTQAAFYDSVIKAPRPPTAVRADRPAAVREFGRPAEVAGGGRPFALPVLREDTKLSQTLAKTIDVLARTR